MIKVGELKKRGIEIVVGDRWRDGIGSDCPVCTSDLEAINRGLYVEELITEFAPRKPLATPPVNGDVMVILSLGSGKVSTINAGVVHWGRSDVISWVPSMKHLVVGAELCKLMPEVKPVLSNCVKSKPVFTQEMADAGESPPVGCLVLVGGNSGKVMLSKDIHGLVVVEVKGFWLLARISECKPLPTERDLTTGDIQDIIVSQGALGKGKITDQIANLIYGAGYRKEGISNA